MQSLRTTHLSPCPRCHLISSTPPLLESRAEGICHLLSELCAEFPSAWGKLQVSEMPPKRLEPQPKGSHAEWPESGSSASPVAGLEGKLLKAGGQTVICKSTGGQSWVPVPASPLSSCLCDFGQDTQPLFLFPSLSDENNKTLLMKGLCKILFLFL